MSEVPKPHSRDAKTIRRVLMGEWAKNGSRLLALQALDNLEEQLDSYRREYSEVMQQRQLEGELAEVMRKELQEQLEAVVGSYVCENCGRLGPLSSFDDDCTPGWTHGRMIEVKALASSPARSPDEIYGDGSGHALPPIVEVGTQVERTDTPDPASSPGVAAGSSALAESYPDSNQERKPS